MVVLSIFIQTHKKELLCYHTELSFVSTSRVVSSLLMYSKSPHIITYQNKNREAVYPKLCALQLIIIIIIIKFFKVGVYNSL